MISLAAALKRNIMIFIVFLLLTFLFFAGATLLAGCSPAKQEVLLPQIAEIDGIKLTARTNERYFEVFTEEGWEPFVVKGVNIGTALPGKYFTQFPMDRDVYRYWLEQAAALNANTIRLYTLLDPLFYQAFRDYNASVPPEQRILLLQEVWPDEEIPGNNYFDSGYMENYQQEIRHVVDALHGNAEIRARRGRAFGSYSADVSPYLLGLLIGNEMEPHVMLENDSFNSKLNGYPGDYVQAVNGASATETWLAMMCDYALAYSLQTYGWQHPISFVSWPTLDPLDHPAEWNIFDDRSMEYNDMAELDPNHLQQGHENLAGFFGCYHIYPNYPDFMNNEPSYDAYEDGQGVFRYGGYLRDFMAVHPPYPALVAEFGMATGLATAHVHPHGLDHGGVTEQQQGEMTMRMMEAILREGYAGGVVFALMDEWAKKTWLTEPFMVPYERNPYWHNALCPEQNYGLLAMEPARIPFLFAEPLYAQPAFTEQAAPKQAGATGTAGREPPAVELRNLLVEHNEAFLYLGLELEVYADTTAPAGADSFQLLPAGSGLMIGLDTYNPGGGNFHFPPQGERSPHGLEFLVIISSDEDAQLLATSSYNRGELRFSASGGSQTAGGTNEKWEPIRPLVNRERISRYGQVFPPVYSNQSILPRGNFYPGNGEYSSTAMFHVNMEEKRVELRLPWALLNFADPSTQMVLDDPATHGDMPLRDTLQTATTPGIYICALSCNLPATGEDIIDVDGISPGAERSRVLDYMPRNSAGDGFAYTLPLYSWEFWEEPVYRVRQKESFPIISTYFSQITRDYAEQLLATAKKLDAGKTKEEASPAEAALFREAGGRVTLSFDDGWLSVFTAAWPVMEQYGYPGVAYVITEFVGEPGRMSLPQLRALQSSGWDISSHSLTHPYFLSDKMSPEQIANEIEGSRLWLQEKGFLAGSRHFSSPGGEYNQPVMVLIQKQYHTHRTIDEGVEAWPPPDLYRLKIGNVINTTEIAQVQGWIDEAISEDGWLVLLFHHIAEPADVDTKVSPATFSKIINYINETNIEVITLSTLLQRVY